MKNKWHLFLWSEIPGVRDVTIITKKGLPTTNIHLRTMARSQTPARRGVILYLSDVMGRIRYSSKYLPCFKIFCIPKTRKSKLALSKIVQKYGMPSTLLLYSLYEDLAKSRALRTKYNDFLESRCIVVSLYRCICVLSANNVP